MPPQNLPATQILPKMPLSDYPPEARAFHYSEALAGCVWAWLAVVFAAISLWRIRAVGSTSAKPDPQPELPKKLTAVPAPTAGPAGNKLLTASPGCHVKGGDWGVTKGRFTAYFHVEGDGGEIEEESDVDCEEETETPTWRWEGMRGDLGWYRYVDLTALDGSVVRLWDRDGGLRWRLV